MVSFEKPSRSTQGITIDSRVSWPYNGLDKPPAAILVDRFLPAVRQIAKLKMITPMFVSWAPSSRRYL